MFLFPLSLKKKSAIDTAMVVESIFCAFKLLFVVDVNVMKKWKRYTE